MFATVSLLSVAAVSAQSDEPEPLICTLNLSFDAAAENPHWQGSISGAIVGSMEMWEQPNNFVVGATEHYFENFTITTTSGDVIKGFDKGIWNFGTYKFRAQGPVTEASGDWAFLVGYDTHSKGFTSAFPPVPPSTVVTGTGTMTLVLP